MESIGSGDKRLPEYLKSLYVTIIHFFSDSVYLPVLQSCTSMIMKLLTTKQVITAQSAASSSASPGNPNTSAAQNSPAPAEIMTILSTILAGIAKLKNHLSSDFVLRGLNQSPNLVLVCKEARRTAAKAIQVAMFPSTVDVWVVYC
jgi:hypothetical protein